MSPYKGGSVDKQAKLIELITQVLIQNIQLDLHIGMTKCERV
jgi:hypothetical protein